jgi:hypothetical protein
VLLAVIVCVSGAVDRTASIIPPYGTLIGVSMDYGVYQSNISAYEAQLTRSPAAFVLFPLVPSERLGSIASQAHLRPNRRSQAHSTCYSGAVRRLSSSTGPCCSGKAVRAGAGMGADGSDRDRPFRARDER